MTIPTKIVIGALFLLEMVREKGTVERLTRQTTVPYRKVNSYISLILLAV